MTLKDVVRYLDLKARAEGNGPEAATSREFMIEMEKEHEGIAAAAVRATVALEAPSRRRTGGTPGADKGNWFENLVDQAVGKFVDNVSAEVAGAPRYVELRRRQVKLERKACADDQVCFELRLRKDDARNAVFREKVLDRIDSMLGGK